MSSRCLTATCVHQQGLSDRSTSKTFEFRGECMGAWSHSQQQWGNWQLTLGVSNLNCGDRTEWKTETWKTYHSNTIDCSLYWTPVCLNCKKTTTTTEKVDWKDSLVFLQIIIQPWLTALQIFTKLSMTYHALFSATLICNHYMDFFYF